MAKEEIHTNFWLASRMIRRSVNCRPASCMAVKYALNKGEGGRVPDANWIELAHGRYSRGVNEPWGYAEAGSFLVTMSICRLFGRLSSWDVTGSDVLSIRMFLVPI
jgi:hypothetical protein